MQDTILEIVFIGYGDANYQNDQTNAHTYDVGIIGVPQFYNFHTNSRLKVGDFGSSPEIGKLH